EAGLLERAPGDRTHRRLVFDDEHAPVPAPRCAFRRRLRGDLLPRLLGSREMDREDSVAGRAVEQDVSACLRDDVLHGREAEPGAAFTLRGEVGLEDTRVEIALYAGAGVLDDEAYESVAARDARLGWRALDRDRRRRDTQAAPVRHGIAGVHRQVQHDLLDLVAVGEDGGVSVQLQ